MLIGNVINSHPHLYRVAVASVPFVDVLSTMLDSSLPLTPLEFNEWGNPEDPDYYHYIKSYSPYDNVAKQKYPDVLMISGVNDPRVTYWEPAKWAAKLREYKQSESDVIFKVYFDSGHFGETGIKGQLGESAWEYAYILNKIGAAQTI